MKISTTTADIANVFGDELVFRMIKEAGFDAVDYGYFENAMLESLKYTGSILKILKKRLKGRSVTW